MDDEETTVPEAANGADTVLDTVKRERVSGQGHKLKALYISIYIYYDFSMQNQQIEYLTHIFPEGPSAACDADPKKPMDKTQREKLSTASVKHKDKKDKKHKQIDIKQEHRSSGSDSAKHIKKKYKSSKRKKHRDSDSDSAKHIKKESKSSKRKKHRDSDSEKHKKKDSKRKKHLNSDRGKKQKLRDVRDA